MDDLRFDNLARRLGGTAPRRAALRTLGGATLGALLGRLGLEAAAAAPSGSCKKVGKPCQKNGDCCKGSRCKKGTCRCLPGRFRCGKVCCGGEQLCVKGTCDAAQGSCPTGLDDCVDDETVTCNGDPTCRCHTTMAGATRCGAFAAGATCGGCTTNAACAAAYGKGAFCAKDTGPYCCQFEPTDGLGRCMLPCPTL